MNFNIVPKVSQDWSIVKIAKEAAPGSWRKVFDTAEPELRHISKILDEEKKFGSYVPLKADLFNAFKYCPLELVKLIILGDEPYGSFIQLDGKQVPKDMGMSFSVRKGDTIPLPLMNIFKELRQSLGTEIPTHGNLIQWARQGVLMLNVCLTITSGKSHARFPLWHGLLNRVFKAINVVNPNCIVLSMVSRNSQNISSMIPDSFVHHESVVPDAYWNDRCFSGCNIFKTINETLTKQGKTPIDWQIR